MSRKKLQHDQAASAEPHPPAASKNADAPEPPAPSSGVWLRRLFFPLLALIVLGALACRILIFREYTAENVFADVPLNDAKAYWDWAGRIAAGALLNDEPFFSAPLYPYLLGLLRSLGGTLDSAYIMQMIFDLATICVLAIGARWRFNAGVGLLAGLLFALLQEPASSFLRILPSSLELLLMSLTWVALSAVEMKGTWPRHLLAGVMLGLLCLAYAPAMLLLIAVVLWLLWQSRLKWSGVLRTAACAAVAIVIVAPATIHNWVVSQPSEFIPIRSGAGITLRQGNHPDSLGGYTKIPGISTQRSRMHEDVIRVYEEQTGNEPTWNGADRYFRQQVVDYWRSNPGRAIELAATKLYWFIAYRNYGDIYQPTAEIEYGILDRLRLVPLPVPLLMGPVLVGLVLMLRHPRRSAPQWLLLAIPLFVVVVFFYSARYRLPAAPAMVVIAAWALERALHWRRHWPVAIAVLLAIAVTLPLGAIARTKGFDRVDLATFHFQRAEAWEQQEDLEQAIEAQREGIEQQRAQSAAAESQAAARVRLGDWLRRLGRLDDALLEYGRADALGAEDPGVLRSTGEILLRQQKFAAAEMVLERAAERAPDDARIIGLLAGAKQLQGRREEAIDEYRRALELDPDNIQVRIALGDALMRLGRLEEALTQFEQVVRSDPDHFQAQFTIGMLRSRLGDQGGARAAFERALFIEPRSVPALHALALTSLMQRRLDEAADYARRGLAIDPNDQKCRTLLERIRQFQARQSGGDRPPETPPQGPPEGPPARPPDGPPEAPR
ncbi:MAG: tetratricopeptide repeat protein [Planctomycetota bacterium]|nr:tetratricopeptide repeat protein [Planctomycetota bacterium]